MGSFCFFSPHRGCYTERNDLNCQDCLLLPYARPKPRCLQGNRKHRREPQQLFDTTSLPTQEGNRQASGRLAQVVRSCLRLIPSLQAFQNTEKSSMAIPGPLGRDGKGLIFSNTLPVKVDTRVLLHQCRQSSERMCLPPMRKAEH